ncbi:Na-translocating NADH-quinone reductase subunit A [Fagus crenata]
MDPSTVPTTPPVEEEDEWDTDGFVIPSLEIGDIDGSKTDASEVEASKPPSPKAKKDEKIYLGPHGAPPSQSKQQELNSTGRKQRFKQKLKEADQRSSGTGRENKLESLKELVGGGKGTVNAMKGTSREWLDPHCHESQFEKWNPQ